MLGFGMITTHSFYGKEDKLFPGFLRENKDKT